MQRAYRQSQPNYASLKPVTGGLAWTSSYDPGLVQAFKATVPPEARKWDAAQKRWIIGAQYGAAVARLCEAYLGVTIAVPAATIPSTTETRILKIEYLGTCKERGNGEASAFGYVDGGWNTIIPESVLREWFEAVPQRPDEKPTLYATLAIKSTATQDEIKSAYRRLARQWHPDVCKEPNATEAFKAIQHAYAILSNEAMRRKYEAGMALEASLKQPSQSDNWLTRVIDSLQYGYRSPLRCGWVLAEGQETLGRFVVSKIEQWEDITDSQGRVLVVSWPAGADKFVEMWQ